jgi:hypothetical protein
MPMSLRRLVGSLAACCSLMAGLAGTAATAHADSTPGAAEAVPKGICFVPGGCGVTLEIVMAPPSGTIVIDWGDGRSDTYTPGAAQFEATHAYSGDQGFNSWNATLTVDGGPATPVLVECVIAGFAGFCD